jgi:hypothetical protein
MKADCIGEFSFETEEACPKCNLMLDEHYYDVECLCGGSDDGMYMQKRDVPWDTCKEIYKRMAKHEPRLNDDFETALKALIEHHGVYALTSLAAVMRQHNLEFHTIDGLTIAYCDAGIVFNIDKSEPITANDIKPEPAHDH